MKRAEFIELLGVGGLVFATGLPGFAAAGPKAAADADAFYFVQLTDTHWGFTGPKANPDAAGTLPKAIAAVNALEPQPDFIVFTGDLTHTTDDPQIRRQRMAEFAAHTNKLKTRKIFYLPGEHDADQDRGQAFTEAFGKVPYAFQHKGIHFIALDNVSQPGSILGETQLAWLAAELKTVPVSSPLVVFAHRPLFDLYPDWDWATKDGQKAIDLLRGHRFVTEFYCHNHQEHHHLTGHIQHHSATSLIFPLPAPGSVPKRAPIPWDPAHPYQGLGFRQIHTQLAKLKAKEGQGFLALSEKALAESLKGTGTTA